MTIGIYRIVNVVTGRTYIGSSVRIQERLGRHRRRLAGGTHQNPSLQASWNKYGCSSFIFEPLKECEDIDLVQTEQRFIDAYIEHGMPIYNHRPSAESRHGFIFRHSDDTKQRMKASQKLADTPARRQKISAALKGRGHAQSAETRAKISATLKAKPGRPQSMETRAKLSAMFKGQPGKTHSAEVRAKLREIRKRQHRTPSGQWGHN